LISSSKLGVWTLYYCGKDKPPKNRQNVVISQKIRPLTKSHLTSWNKGSGLKKQQQLMMGEESKSEKVPKKQQNTV